MTAFGDRMTAPVKPQGVAAARPRLRVMNEEEEANAISRLIERLVVRFPKVPTRRVEETVSSAHQAFEGARVRGFVPLLVEHDVLIQLKDLAGQADLVAKPEQGRWARKRLAKPRTLLLGLGRLLVAQAPCQSPMASRPRATISGSGSPTTSGSLPS